MVALVANRGCTLEVQLVADEVASLGPSLEGGPEVQLTATSTGRNRHPVDELADVRAEIKTLQAREAELRAVLLADGADLSGSEHYARVTVSERETLDAKAITEALGKDALSRFMRKQ